MELFDGLLFDCDNHDYEAEDAFTRYVPKRMQKRCVQWAEMDGKRYHLVVGKLSRSVGSSNKARDAARASWESRKARATRASSWCSSLSAMDMEFPEPLQVGHRKAILGY